MAGGLDFSKLAKEARFDAVIAEEAKADRYMRLARLGGAVFVIVVVTIASLVIIGFGSEARNSESAWNLLQTIVGGAIGFWAGQRDDRG